MATNSKLTTVKIIEDLYKEFKRKSLDTGMTLQKIVNRSLYHYVEDSKFSDRIHETTQLMPSGSIY